MYRTILLATLLATSALPALCDLPVEPIGHWTFDALEDELKDVPTDRKVLRHSLRGAVLDTPIERETEQARVTSTVDAAQGVVARLHGSYYRTLPGVRSDCLQLDGNSSFASVEADEVPGVSGGFAVMGWFALGAYPTNWCPLTDHGSAQESGYFLGVDAYGRTGFKVFVDGKQHEAIGEKRTGLREWTHIAGVYTPDEGLALYVNGALAASEKATGTFKPAKESELLIGRHSIQRRPEGTIRPNATAPVFTFFDGVLDELIIFDEAIGPDQIAAYVGTAKPAGSPPLKPRVLPTGPPGPGRFGAVYTTLKYYDAWDALWRVGDQADVYVRFDESPCRFVFWRGTSYIPHWVTENGIWYDNEFNEAWSDKGCHEPMSDKRCEHSHVRVIENHDARVVIHWRYALVDNWYNLAYIDELTGWGGLDG